MTDHTIRFIVTKDKQIVSVPGGGYNTVNNATDLMSSIYLGILCDLNVETNRVFNFN